jgi:acetate kinase
MSSKLLVLNAGSSSLKFKLFQVEESSCTPIAWGLCERLGDLARSRLKAEATDLGGNTTSTTAPEPMEDHAAALDQAKKFLQARYSPSLISDVGIVGHRVVHGLHTSDPVVIE